MSTEFSGDQYEDVYPEGIERLWWQVARNAIIARAFARSIPRGERILEVGCGTGIVTRHLRGRGWDVMGVDIGSPRHGLHAPEHLFLGRAAEDLPKDFRDTITVLALFDVIEHIADAPAFLQGLLRAFENARTVVVAVPARKELWSDFDDHYGHFRRYDRALLRAHLQAAGLCTVRARYFFHGLYAAIALNNLLRGRKRTIRYQAPAPGLASAAHALLGRLFAVEAAVLPGALAGSSIMAVARRD